MLATPEAARAAQSLTSLCLTVTGGVASYALRSPWPVFVAVACALLAVTGYERHLRRYAGQMSESMSDAEYATWFGAHSLTPEQRAALPAELQNHPGDYPGVCGPEHGTCRVCHHSPGIHDAVKHATSGSPLPAPGGAG